MDYPKPDGYRSVHFIYEYRSQRTQTYNGMRIEIQIRSHLQHVWATAVETVDAFEEQGLKSGRGADDWRRFFALMGDVIARKEGCPRIPHMPDENSVRREVARYADALQLESRLGAYTALAREIPLVAASGDNYYVLELRPEEQLVLFAPYSGSRDGADEAARRYFETEAQNEGNPTRDVVMVRVSSLQALKSAYPNYFPDTHEFVALVREARE